MFGHFPSAADPTTVINLLVQAGYAKYGLTPNPVCSDRAFVRRLYIDLAGRIPTLTEARDFLTDTDSNKRSKLVEQLIDSDDYIRHMAESFDTMLMGRNESKLPGSQETRLA